MANLKAELDDKLAEAQSLNMNLQNELSKLKVDHITRQKQPIKHSHSSSFYDNSDDEIREKFDELSIKHEELKQELYEQQQVFLPFLMF